MEDKMQIFGLLPDPLDPRDVWEDELGGEGDLASLPKSYRTEGLKFEPQGRWPFCVAMSITKMFEHQRAGAGLEHVELSQPHLFFNGQGGKKGSYTRVLLELARTKGFRLIGDCPMPANLWNADNFFEERDKALAVPFDGVYKIPGYTHVNPDRETLKRKIMEYGMVVVGVYAGGGYFADKTPRKGETDNHLTLLVGWDEDDSWWVFDSVQPAKNQPYSGYHRLSKDYDFHQRYVIRELPEDWKEKRDQVRSEPFQNALSHYGENRNLEREQAAAKELLEAFERFKNQSVFEAAGRFWTVLINARAYGGYNVSYEKNGQWMPGDLINWVYQWRRDPAKVPFDLNQKRPVNK